MQRIGFIVFPDFEVLSLDTATVFEVANMVAQEQLYDLHVLSEAGGAVRTSIGMAVDSEAFDETALRVGERHGDRSWDSSLSKTTFADSHRLCQESPGKVPKGCIDLHWGARPCRSRFARRSSRDNSLALWQRSCGPLPKGEGGTRSHVYQ